jgi:hypothetical protein
MRLGLMSLALALPTLAFAAAPPPPALAATVNSFVQTCSNTDAAGFAAVFTKAPNIVDDIAPYDWHGKDAAATYIAALQATIKSAGWDHFGLAANGAPYIEVAENFAYATVPLFVNYTHAGKPRQDAGIFTLSLKKAGKDWKISSASWTYTKQSS